MSINRYAIVRTADNAVVNVIQWDGDTTKWSPPEGHTARVATAADVIALPVEQQNQTAMESGLDNALDNLRAYVGLASPTAAQTAAVVKLLCLVAIRIIRLRSGRLSQAAE